MQWILTRAFGHPTGLLGRLGGRIMARANRRIAARVVDLLGAKAGERVLEIGFGPGVALELLARSVPDVTIAGIDPSREMIDQASTRNAAMVRGGRMELRQASAERLPFTDATFDRAFAINSMQLWSDVQAGLRETRRVLKPGGVLLLGFTRHSGQQRDGLRELLEAAGFVDVRLSSGPEEADFCVRAVNP
ncbi:MAG: class I SAM-dependent methyltransferase [Pseudomonadota bacterium]|nr:MAG: methyltransferase type 11 [Pseudomonadota bacterium]